MKTRKTVFFKRILSTITSLAIMLTLATSSGIFAKAVEIPKYPYTIFGRNGITFNTGSLSVNGNIHTNKTFTTTAKNFNKNGTLTTGANLGFEERIKHVYADGKIQSTYFMENCDFFEEAYTRNDMNINLNKSVFSLSDISLTGNVSANNANLGTLTNIEISGQNLNLNTSAMYSKYGNITINGQNSLSLTGLFYAPLGTITVNATNVNFNNAIIIADKIVVNTAQNININNNDNLAKIIGNESESYDFSDLEYLPESWLGDSDEDGLIDVYERVIDTDQFNPDTDGDGLPDGYEYWILETDPLHIDTDGNGISDSDEDFDDDGLSNLREYQNKTDPFNPDSDDDYLNDGDEVTYGTEPLDSDTDDDGLLDGEEGYYGTIYAKYRIYFNPLNLDTDGNGVLDGDETFGQTVSQPVETEDDVITNISVEMKTNKDLEHSLTIESTMGINPLSSNLVGLVGEPLDFNTTSEFKSASITFTVDKAKLGNKNFYDLIVLWYDEKNQKYVEMQSSRNATNSTITFTTTHFSEYMITDSEEWYESWEDSYNHIKNISIPGGSMYPTGTYYNTIISIDTSDKMRQDDTFNWAFIIGQNGCTANIIASLNQPTMEEYERYGTKIYGSMTIAQNLIKNLRTGDKIAIVKFCNTYTKTINFTSNKDDLLDFLYEDHNYATTNTSYGSDISVAFGKAYNIFSAEFGKTNTENRMMLMTNSAFQSSETNLNKLINDVQIHTVGFGGSESNNLLGAISALTKKPGTLYLPISAKDLTRNYGGIPYTNLELDFKSLTHSDIDGIPNVIELYGLKPNGEKIGTDPANTDTDGDGLDDNVEISYSENQLQAIVNGNFIANGFKIITDPLKEDTDDDGILDGDEVNWNGIDTRYQKLNPLKKDTLQSLYPDIKKNNNRDNPVYLDIKGNHITICIYYDFFTVNDYAQLTNVTTPYLSEDLLKDAINSKWNNLSFVGTEYDFYPGMKITVDVQMIKRSFMDGKTVTMGYSSEGNFSFTRNIWGVHVDWNTKRSKSIWLTDAPDTLQEKFNGAAHELGHVLGLGDMYGDDNKKNKRLQPVVINMNNPSDCEIFYDYTNTKKNDIMFSDGEVKLNDIEMILQAFIEDTQQRFRPQIEDKSYNVSKAIKQYDSKIFYDRINGYFMEYNPTNHSVSKLGSNGDANDFHNWLFITHGINIPANTIKSKVGI